MLGSRLAADTLPGAVALAQQPRLNILLILADNFGYGGLGVYDGGEPRGAPTRSREASESAGREFDAILKLLNVAILKSL
jgi:arylsulfatase